MKQILALSLAAAMLAALFTGCGCAANVSDHPGGMITSEPTVMPTVMPHPTATHETTRPTETTRPHETTVPTLPMTEPTNSGSVPTGEGTTPTDATINPRSQRRNTVR